MLFYLTCLYFTCQQSGKAKPTISPYETKLHFSGSGVLCWEKYLVAPTEFSLLLQRVCFYLPGQNCMIRDRDSRCFCEEMAIAANVSPTNLLWLTYPMNPTHHRRKWPKKKSSKLLLFYKLFEISIMSVRCHGPGVCIEV